MLGLDYRFDEALILIARHQPSQASENHLTCYWALPSVSFAACPTMPSAI